MSKSWVNTRLISFYSAFANSCSVQALHEMFKDLALMVEQQGEMLNNIEKNVEQAKDYVADAERQTQQAVDYTNKFRKVFIFYQFCF